MRVLSIEVVFLASWLGLFLNALHALVCLGVCACACACVHVFVNVCSRGDSPALSPLFRALALS